jgi:hypothetical protein
MSAEFNLSRVVNQAISQTTAFVKAQAALLPPGWENCAKVSFALSAVTSFFFSRLNPTKAITSGAFAAVCSLSHSLADVALQQLKIRNNQSLILGDRTNQDEVPKMFTINSKVASSAIKVLTILLAFACFDRGSNWRGNAVISIVITFLEFPEIVKNRFYPSEGPREESIVRAHVGTYCVI